MNALSSGARRVPLSCPACGNPMNRHAEKLVLPTTSEEFASFDLVLHGVLEEHHLCPFCGHLESLRSAS